MRTKLLTASLLCCNLFAFCQEQGPQSVVNINIKISRSVAAVNYQTNSSTRIDFKGTPLLPFAQGKATVGNKKGLISVDASFSKMSSATQLGPEFLTYVVWAITPEGRASNLGELQLNGDKGKLSVTTRLPNFAMIVTAEPYFSVSAPSEMVVLQNVPGEDTKGATTPVTATLLSRGTYSGANLAPLNVDPKVPLAVYEARNAIRIAQVEGAEKYAPDAWSRASQTAAQMEDYLAKKQKDPTITAARNAAQQAEDARSIAVKQAAAEKIAAEKRAQAEELASQQQQAAQREAELKAQQEAEAQRAAQSAALAAQEAQARAQAEAAQKQAEAAKKQAQEEAAKSAAAAAQAQQEQQQLRAQLLAQLNSVLQTVDTPRGLVVTMADVLFASGKYELSQDASLKLARLSGVILAHPGLKLRIEGYTDTTGSEAFNFTLSGQRANAVRTFLVEQGLKPEDVTSAGMGQANPVADNSTAAGRQQNRRVEIIVSGEAIGASIGQ
ncbi:MAG: OmpA family protein [Terriglobales bacterium]|jgi:outer membrane protein OmpA-like peptidoglycan-associated protein